MSNQRDKPFMNFGEHLALDGYGGDPKKLNDRNLVLQWLSDLPGKIGTTIIGGPEVYFADEGHTKDPGGWSGFVVIAESHISIHTFPKRCFVSADVYTCNTEGLDREFIEDYFRKLFGLTDIEINAIKRGTRYPSCNIH